MFRDREPRPSRVEIRRDRTGVRAHYRGEIPQIPLMRSLVNHALMVRFGLDVNFDAEGGVIGRHKGDLIDYTNLGVWSSGSYIGLFDANYNPDYERPENPGQIEVLNFYEAMLRKLFEGKREKDITRGKYSKPDDVTKLVMDVIREVGDADLVSRVMRRLVDETPWVRRYSRGLNDEEISATYVDPPTF